MKCPSLLLSPRASLRSESDRVSDCKAFKKWGVSRRARRGVPAFQGHCQNLICAPPQRAVHNLFAIDWLF